MQGMTSDDTSELFPIMDTGQRDFEVAMRGYDRRQVDDYVARSEAELTALTGERDSAAGRSADLAAQLANSQAQIESLRRRLSESVQEITTDNVHARVRPIVELAHTEARTIRESADADAMRTRHLADADAAETRRQAAADAERMRAQGQADLQRASEAALQRQSEADNLLANAQTAVAEQLNSARAEATRLLTETRAEVERLSIEARATRTRLDAEAAARRVTANEDFEIALRVRRTEEEKVDADRHAGAVAEAHRIVAEANNHALRVVHEATDKVNRLTGLRDRVHVDLSQLHGRLGDVLTASVAAAATHVEAPAPAEQADGAAPESHTDELPDLSTSAEAETVAPEPDAAASVAAETAASEPVASGDGQGQ